MPDDIRLKIAGITYAISSDEESLRWLEEMYVPFLSRADTAFTVRIVRVCLLEKAGRQAAPGIFLDAGPHFRIAFDFAKATAAVTARRSAGIVDIVKSVVSTVCLARGGALLHACAVSDGSTSRVFFGPSGSGKTTIARLAEDRLVLTDETTALVNERGQWHAYATPFNGEYGPAALNVGYPIAGFYSLKKSSSFGHRSLGRAEAVKGLFACVFMPSADPFFVGQALETIEAAAGSVPCRGLRFAREVSLWRYIDERVECGPQAGHCLADH